MTQTKIFTQFERCGENPDSEHTQIEIGLIMDRLAKMNSQHTEFNKEILQQLWDQTDKTTTGKVKIKDFIKTIMKIKRILVRSIDQEQKQFESKEGRQRKSEIEANLSQLKGDLRVINDSFGLHSQRSQGLDQDSELFAGNNATQLESTHLKLVFLIIFVMFLLEIFCMFVRHHFTNILVYLGVLSIFFLNYFHSKYIKILLVMIIIAIVSDIAWFILQGEIFSNSSKNTQYSHYSSELLGIIYILTIIMSIAKVLVLLLLFRFRNNSQQTRKTVIACGFRANLKGALRNDPVSRLFTYKKDI